jgi:hypothetical protein
MVVASGTDVENSNLYILLLEINRKEKMKNMLLLNLVGARLSSARGIHMVSPPRNVAQWQSYSLPLEAKHTLLLIWSSWKCM